MAIAINPDVRELDFSDNVKVSKFMQDFSDFRAKKWITYRPVNAPSASEPFVGGTRQFIINMGTGHILDTTYSGLWYTLKFANGSTETLWPFSTTLPRTSTAWIESVTFQHSNVAAHIDERLTDYDAVSAIFVPAKDIKSMDQTFFHFDYSQCADGNPFNTFAADDPYGKMYPCGLDTTQRLNYGSASFFIPLNRLSTIFNSGKYFFPSLLRGNGEMTISIRSVANTLSEVFGGDGCGYSSFASANPQDRIHRTLDEPLKWTAFMVDMKLITLNLDNAFLTKEYNAFIASGRKFIRSFKAYNYQYYEVKNGYNRIEIANTHQSISHIILAFQADYSVRLNGRQVDVIGDLMLGNQRTAAVPQIALQSAKAFNTKGPAKPPDPVQDTMFTPILPSKDGNINNDLQQHVGFHVGVDDYSLNMGDSVSASPIIENGRSQSILARAYNMSKSIVNSMAGSTKHAVQAGIDALVEGKTVNEAAQTAVLAAVKHTMNNAKAPQEAGSAASVRSESAMKDGKAKSTRVQTRKDLLNDLQKNNTQLQLTQARCNEILTDLNSVQFKPSIKKNIDEWREIIRDAYPDFDWTKLGDKKIRDENAFLGYVQALLTNQNNYAQGVRNRMIRIDTLFGQTANLTASQKALLSLLFAVPNNRMRQLGGDYITNQLANLKPETLALVKHAYNLGKKIPSSSDEFADFCKNAANAFQTNVVDTCAEMGIVEALVQDQAVMDAEGNLIIEVLGGTPAPEGSAKPSQPGQIVDGAATFSRKARGMDTTMHLSQIIVSQLMPAVPAEKGEAVFTPTQVEYISRVMSTILSGVFQNERLTWHNYTSLLLPCGAKQIYDIGPHVIEKLQVYRGTGNGETVFSEPINENMFYHVSREALGDAAENHPFFSRKDFDRGCSYVVISLNTFMRDAHHEFWDGFSTNRVADRLYVEFEDAYLVPSNLVSIPPWYYDLAYIDNVKKLVCKVFTVYDNIYYIDRNNNLNVSDTLLPLQEGRAPGAE